jgi:hypothetical protein
MPLNLPATKISAAKEQERMLVDKVTVVYRELRTFGEPRLALCQANVAG